MTENKLPTLLKDESFVKALLAAETPEAMVALAAENQAEITLEEARQARLFIGKARSGEIDAHQYLNENGELKKELTPEELESVSGGSLISALLILFCS